MAVMAWICGIFLLTQFFSDHEADRYNPNREPTTSHSKDRSQVVLTANRRGHYLVSGNINGKPVTFMLDTGATDVVIPIDLKQKLDLTSYGRGAALTANGRVELENSFIDSLSIGEINLYNVPASLNPGMSAEQPILLGMSALKQLELFKSDGKLTLTQKY